MVSRHGGASESGIMLELSESSHESSVGGFISGVVFDVGTFHLVGDDSEEDVVLKPREEECLLTRNKCYVLCMEREICSYKVFLW